MNQVIQLPAPPEQSLANNWEFELAELPVRYERGGPDDLGFCKIPDRKAIVRPDTGECLAVVSQQYRLVHNKEIASRADELIDTYFPEFGPYTLKNIVIGNGRRFFREYRFTDVRFAVSPGDYINPTVRFGNSYDGSMGFQIDFGAFRLVCSNGLVVGKQFFRCRKLHKQSLEIAKDFNELKTAMERFSDQVGLWQGWVDHPVPEKEKTEIIEEMQFSQKHTEMAENNFLEAEARNGMVTRWVMFNILTSIITHKLKSEQHKQSLQARLSNTIYRRWS